MKEGVISNLQRMSTEDGPGIRTTVFFKGCTLACKWCHNPESISFDKELEWFDNKCIRCKTCVNICIDNAASFDNDKLKINESICKKCLNCTENCPTNAIEAKGICWKVDNLYDELMKDKAYFSNGGGVTLSGGEVLAQSEYAYELLKKLKESGIHTAVDTCGHVTFNNIEKIYEVTSLFLYDLKIYESDLHEKHTGVGNKLILDNFIRLSQKIREDSKAKLWVRTPLIPGITDTEQNIRQISQFICNNSIDIVERWELLSFNNLCEAKYTRLDKNWEFKNVLMQSKNKLIEIEDIISEYDGLKGKAFVTGSGSKV